ncbi:hypothetical protein [Parapedobacter sp. 10938]|uniref:hypothetical protein n=1 Tax=Parapedobacter flavus TaxID=3110225 RepID=UPI002DB6D743|nr:hypothetical protein [Parapedobacter sp. 10938]
MMIGIYVMMAMPLSSCTKKATIIPDKIIAETPGDNETDSTDNDYSITEPSPVSQKMLVSGDTNGKLVIDGNTGKYNCHTQIIIKAGVYTNIQIKNLKGQEGCPIRITNDGLVEVVGFRKHMLISNVSNIEITGNGNTDIENGFLFRDNEYRAIELLGAINGLSVQYFEFKNIGNHVISYNSDVVYDGSPGSYASNLTFSHLTADNTGALINFGGGINGSAIQGLVKNLEISHVSFNNAPTVRNAVYVGMVEGYDIHHNRFQHVNMHEDNHNAMFFMRGNGRFHNNYISDHQGNALRAWGVSIGSAPKEILAYNNIVVNSRKYSAFEIQSFADDMISGKTTFVNAKIFHNTCGNLNTSRDWYGVVLDAYRLLGGSCQVFNNLVFNLPAPHPKSNFVSYMSIEEGMLTTTNNLYSPTSTAAGIVNENDFRLNSSSKAKGTGKKINLVSLDFYSAPRNVSAPSIGAVE